MRTQALTTAERLYREHGARLQRAVMLFAGSRDVAEDAVAEAFAQLLAARTEIRDPLAWVWRTSFRVAAGELKALRRTGGTMPELSEEAVDATGELAGALRRLSPKQRGALVLHYYAGYPAKAIASILGSSTAAVHVHLSQGRKRLRSLLEDDDG